jgi:hypothetical protein
MILSLIMVEQIAFKYVAKMVDTPENLLIKKNLPYGLTSGQICKLDFVELDLTNHNEKTALFYF